MISLLLHNSFHSRHASLKKKLIEELEMELAETNCHIWLMKTRYPYGCQAFRFIEKRSDTPGYFSMITILGRQHHRGVAGWDSRREEGSAGTIDLWTIFRTHGKANNLQVIGRK